MADIHIEKRRKKPVWPWILGLLLLAGIIWGIAGIDSEPEREGVAVVENPYISEPIATEPVADRMNEENNINNERFVAFVEDRDIREKMGIDHQVTSQALMKLAASLSEISGDDNRYTQQLEELRQAAQDIQSDPQSLQHADKVKQAFSSAADLMAQIQSDRFPDAEDEIQELRKSVDELNSNEPLTDQKKAVDSFFEEAADVVEDMKEDANVTP